MTVDHNDPKLVELNAALQRARDRVEGATHDLHRAVGDRTGPRGGIITWLLNDDQARGKAMRQAYAIGDVANVASVSPETRRAAAKAERALSALAQAELALAGAEDDVNAYYAEVEPDYCRRVDG